MKTYLNICILAILFTSELASQVPWSQRGSENSVPNWVAQRFNDQQLSKKFSLSFHMNPFYLRGDFNGDGKLDIAILVRETGTNKVGIAICHDRDKKVFIVGAGTLYDIAKHDDLKWMDAWVVRPGKDRKERICVWRTESGGGVFDWTGTRYVWSSFPYD